MKTAATRRALTLFPEAEATPAPLAFEARLREFARASASRSREPADVDRFLTALQAYHATWSLCSRTAVPALDERALGVAVAAYCAATAKARRPAA